jgi:quercetin dioxygenase-like cupin family protein
MAHDETELTPEDMQKRVARFADLVPYKDTMNAAHGIAPEAMQLMSSDKVFPVMSPEGWAGRSKIAPIKGAPGLTVTIAECPPGDSSGLHKHTDTVENFFCIEGEIEIVWGSEGENAITLGPLDFVSIPAGVYREGACSWPSRPHPRKPRTRSSTPPPRAKKSNAASAARPATPWRESASGSANNADPIACSTWPCPPTCSATTS